MLGNNNAGGLDSRFAQFQGQGQPGGVGGGGFPGLGGGNNMQALQSLQGNYGQLQNQLQAGRWVRWQACCAVGGCMWVC